MTNDHLQRKRGTLNKLDPALAEAIAHPPDGTEWGLQCAGVAVRSA
jgi:hypothetical protein